MIEARPHEGGGIEVAGFARCIGHDVAGGFRCRHDAPAQRMATIAFLCRTFEYAGDVASFTGCSGMPAGKRKTGGHVVEVAPGYLRFGLRL
jgi:hypothetical protein